MELLFLIGLLALIVWFNRGLFGFDKKGCDWVGADSPDQDGSRKWMCQKSGRVVVTQDGQVPSEPCGADHG